ncbi:hypothetical protein PENTCL1PPCAC_3915, partial [Pristionchus entomophagus]
RALLLLLLLVAVALGINVTLINKCPFIVNARVKSGCGYHPLPLAPGLVEPHIFCGNTVRIKNEDSGKTEGYIAQLWFVNQPLSTYNINIAAGFDIGMEITPIDDLSLGTLSCTNANCFGGNTVN